MNSPLHPNLARLAASYDNIIEYHRSGRISAREARGRIAALVGRDDTGLLWTIDPDSGRWSYQNLRGELVEAEPPRFGFASVTPGELGSGAKGELDARLTFYEVDPTNFELPAVSATQNPRRQSTSSLIRSASQRLLQICSSFKSSRRR